MKDFFGNRVYYKTDVERRFVVTEDLVDLVLEDARVWVSDEKGVWRLLVGATRTKTLSGHEKVALVFREKDKTLVEERIAEVLSMCEIEILKKRRKKKCDFWEI